MATVATVVAKGPTAEHARRWLQGDVVTINDAHRLLPGVNVRYCFFTHSLYVQTPCDRIQTHVSPNVRTFEGVNPPQWMREHIEYNERVCGGADDELIERIVAGGITHHNTVNGCLHWLSKFGRYNLIRVIGVDGGRDYARGLQGLGGPNSEMARQLVESHGTADFLDIWRDVTIRLAAILSNVYGVRFEFYGD